MESTSNDAKWLAYLDAKLWKDVEYTEWYNGSHRRRKSREIAGTITQSQLTLLAALVRRNGLAVTLGSGMMGFGYSMALHKDPIVPFPGADLPVECVFVLTSQHFRDGKYGEDIHAQKTAAWNYFASLALTPDNEERCAYLKLPIPINDAAHYDY